MSWAAKPINLLHQPLSLLQSFFTVPVSKSLDASDSLKEISSHTDLNHTTHIRIQQTYSGYPVWNGNAVVHVPASHYLKIEDDQALRSLLKHNKNISASMNGIIYQDISADLQAKPADLISPENADKVFQQALQYYQIKVGMKQNIHEHLSQLIVYIDGDNKAHWAFLISFISRSQQGLPAQPTYILDAISYHIYQEWNDVQTLDDVMGGGFGGNLNIGKLSYDGLVGHYPTLAMQRDAKAKICYLQNSLAVVKDVRKPVSDEDFAVLQFSCKKLNNQHNHIYWNADQDASNGGYSPGNDGLYVWKVVEEMYLNWYGVLAIAEDDKPLPIEIYVHAVGANAFWFDNKQKKRKMMVFGDGQPEEGKPQEFYPFVSIGVGAHEISHGFTQQHSNLQYYGESGGLNESYSDMAVQAAELYSTGHNDWQIASEIRIVKDSALRYMDEPTRDCNGVMPGKKCSIDNMKDYTDDMDNHYSSGILNKAFYLIGTTPDWDAKKAFAILVQANQFYWTPTTTFADAACGIMQATQDLKYDTNVVSKALSDVGLNIQPC
jgi:pseudolysin